MQKGCKKLTTHTVDTDGVVLAEASLSNTAPGELWFAFGLGTNFRYIYVDKMGATMTTTKYLTLPVLHAFTSCATVSSFAGR